MFECFVETKYLNGLRLDCFSQLLTDNAQGYKFYWLEAIVELSIDSDGDIPFDEIFNQMIFNAWYSKTYYHLRLGPVVKENNKYNSVQAISEQNNEDPELDEGNYLEQAITKLNKYEPKLLKGNIKADIIKAAINKHSNDLLSFKMDLCNYVPHRLLTPFFKDNDLKEGLNYIKKDSRRKFYKYLSELDPKYNPLYIIVDGRGIDKKIRLNKFWKSFLVDNYVFIKDWIQFNKVQYLQDHNPGVPDISRKITLVKW